MRRVNEGVNQPSLQYIVETIYSFYRMTGNLGSAISQAAQELDMDVSAVQGVADEYDLTEEFANDPGQAVTLGEEFRVPGTDIILEKGDKILIRKKITESLDQDFGRATSQNVDAFKAGQAFGGSLYHALSGNYADEDVANFMAGVNDQIQL